MKKILTLFFMTISAIVIIFTAGAANRAPKSVEVVSHCIELRNIYSSIICSGTIRENRTDAITLGNHAKILEVYVKAGDTVKKGDPLFTAERINDVDFEQYQNVFGEAIGKTIEEYASKSITGSFETEGTLEVEKKQVEYRVFDKKTTVYAHMDGIVTGTAVSENAVTLKNTECVTISDTSSLYVYAGIPERHMTSVKTGQSVVVTGDAFTSSYTGKVTKMMPVATKTGSLLSGSETVVECVVKLDSTGSDLRPGYTASVKIVTDVRRSVPVVPYEAIMQDEDNNEYVFVLFDGRIYKNYIKTGVELEDITEVVRGINAGQLVVLNPSEDLYPGAYAHKTE